MGQAVCLKDGSENDFRANQFAHTTENIYSNS